MKKNFINILKNLDVVLAGIALISVVIVTFLGVIMRYVVNHPIIWGEEVQIALFLFIIFIGAGIAFRTGSHVAIEFIVDRLPKKLSKAVEIAIFIISIAIIIFFFLQSLKLINQLAQTQRTTSILDIPSSLIYSVVPIGCISMIINYSIATYHKFFKKDK